MVMDEHKVVFYPSPQTTKLTVTLPLGVITSFILSDKNNVNTVETKREQTSNFTGEITEI